MSQCHWNSLSSKSWVQNSPGRRHGSGRISGAAMGWDIWPSLSCLTSGPWGERVSNSWAAASEVWKLGWEVWLDLPQPGDSCGWRLSQKTLFTSVSSSRNLFCLLKIHNGKGTVAKSKLFLPWRTLARGKWISWWVVWEWISDPNHFNFFLEEFRQMEFVSWPHWSPG